VKTRPTSTKRGAKTRRTILVSLSPSEYREIAFEAKRAGVPVSTYVRQYLTTGLAL
jgi:hypothetical protein